MAQYISLWYIFMYLLYSRRHFVYKVVNSLANHNETATVIIPRKRINIVWINKYIDRVIPSGPAILLVYGLRYLIDSFPSKPNEYITTNAILRHFYFLYTYAIRRVKVKNIFNFDFHCCGNFVDYSSWPIHPRLRWRNLYQQSLCVWLNFSVEILANFKATCCAVCVRIQYATIYYPHTVLL
jgi:hypothetical protein